MSEGERGRVRANAPNETKPMTDLRAGKRGFPHREVAPGTSPRSSGTILILVVERDPHIRELEAHFLHEAGYGVEFANDGNAALELARQLHPDVVITEILVPKLDGLALCRQLKADAKTRGITVVVFSILAAQGRALEAGADAFLMKPLAEHRLVGTVKTLMGQYAPNSDENGKQA